MTSVVQLVRDAVANATSLARFAQEKASDTRLDYQSIYDGASEWRLLTPIDHPDEPSRCLVSGTGLTHLGSAAQRQQMHEAKETDLTDSMKMFRLGLAEGKPAPGTIGAAPEWFYKGTGTILRPHGAMLDVPAYAEDGGEEGEISGLRCDRRPGSAAGGQDQEKGDGIFHMRNPKNKMIDQSSSS